MVPSLLEHPGSEASFQSSDDDPNKFFEDDESIEEIEYTSSELERIDGEQISVHSGMSGGTAASDAKSLQGSEIILNAASFLTDDNLLQKERPGLDIRSDSSPRSITKLIVPEDDIATFSAVQKPISHPSDTITHATPSTASISVSTAFKVLPGNTQKFTKAKNSLRPPLSVRKENIEHETSSQNCSKSDHAECADEADSSARTEFDIPNLPQHSFARRWSFSSSIGGNDDDLDADEKNSTRPPSPDSSSKSQEEVSSESSDKKFSSLYEQELYMKLSEEDDLRDFKHINNFSFDGDYLLSRILRERTRIQMKRDMLSTPDKDLYVKTHARDCKTPQPGERSVYFLI